MGRNKELLAAGIVRDIRFKNREAYNNYLLKLQYHRQEYEVLKRWGSPEGVVQARIVVQYNDTPLIKLWD